MRVVILLFFLAFFPSQVFAQATIGIDDNFAIEPIVFLSAATPEAAVFNYFFTLEVFAGMVALFIRICIKILRL
jgi:hypothetical protein